MMVALSSLSVVLMFSFCGYISTELQKRIPDPPTNFNFEVDPDDSTTITVTWTESVQTGPIDEVDEYVVERVATGRGFYLTDYVFRGNVSSGVLSDLSRGNTYRYRLRARNVAGLSQPSNTVYYAPPSIAPTLSYFNASALEDGRSILLKWKLASSGGSRISEFRLKTTPQLPDFYYVPDTTKGLLLNINSGTYLLERLKHETHYQFQSVVSNYAGSSTYFAEANTTIAPPNRPTHPRTTSRTTSFIKISFSVEFGTKPITHFLINITEHGSEVQKRFPINAVEYVDSLEDVVSSDGTVIGYQVGMRVTDLKQKKTYGIKVAAESSIGVGLFTSPVYLKLLNIDFIIGGVIGILLIVIFIAIAIVLCICCARKKRRKMILSYICKRCSAWRKKRKNNTEGLRRAHKPKKEQLMAVIILTPTQNTPTSTNLLLLSPDEPT